MPTPVTTVEPAKPNASVNGTWAVYLMNDQTDYPDTSVLSHYMLVKDETGKTPTGNVRWYVKKPNGPAFHAIHGAIPLWNASNHFLFLSALAKLTKLQTTPGHDHKAQLRNWADRMLPQLAASHDAVAKATGDLPRDESTLAARILGVYKESTYVGSDSDICSIPCSVCMWFRFDHRRPEKPTAEDNTTLAEATIQQVMQRLISRIDHAVGCMNRHPNLTDSDRGVVKVLVDARATIYNIARSYPGTATAVLAPASIPQQTTAPIPSVSNAWAKPMSQPVSNAWAKPMSQPVSYAAALAGKSVSK